MRLLKNVVNENRIDKIRLYDRHNDQKRNSSTFSKLQKLSKPDYLNLEAQKFFNFL